MPTHARGLHEALVIPALEAALEQLANDLLGVRTSSPILVP